MARPPRPPAGDGAGRSHWGQSRVQRRLGPRAGQLRVPTPSWSAWNSPMTLTDTQADLSIRLPGGRLGFLLIHGLGGTPMELSYVAQGLARAGHTVHVPQLAGHCGTADELKATGWTDWYASVEREHDRLKSGCDAIVVGGLSVGSILAL